MASYSAAACVLFLASCWRSVCKRSEFTAMCRKRMPIQVIGMRFRHIAVNSDLLQTLRQHDAKNSTQAAALYEAISFYPGAKVVFDDALPSKSWSSLVAYLDLRNTSGIGELETAKKLLEPSLEVLAQNKAIAK